ncbi:hypothetical protein ACFE04_008373 [Oxalis oulophora]
MEGPGDSESAVRQARYSDRRDRAGSVTESGRYARDSLYWRDNLEIRMVIQPVKPQIGASFPSSSPSYESRANSPSSDQEGQKQKRDAFYQSKADTAPHAPTVRFLRNKRGGSLRPEQVGLGYRAVSAVGGDRERARTVHRRIREGNRSDVSLTQPGNGPEGTAAWGMSASRRKAHFELWVIGRAALSDQGLGHKGLGII